MMKSQNTDDEAQFVDLESLRCYVDLIRSIKEDTLEKIAWKVNDDDSTAAMTDHTASLSVSTTFDISMIDVPSIAASQQYQCDCTQSPTVNKEPPSFLKSENLESPLHASPKNEMEDAETEYQRAGQYFEDANDWFASCFNCTNSYAPPTTVLSHYNYISTTPGFQATFSEEEDYYNRNPIIRFPFGNRIG